MIVNIYYLNVLFLKASFKNMWETKTIILSFDLIRSGGFGGGRRDDRDRRGGGYGGGGRDDRSRDRDRSKIDYFHNMNIFLNFV